MRKLFAGLFIASIGLLLNISASANTNTTNTGFDATVNTDIGSGTGANFPAPIKLPPRKADIPILNKDTEKNNDIHQERNGITNYQFLQ
ncbi:hypothetical protein [Legionella cardiaca]|uniref:Uncharacterized protein n=1 Tax=Legionella cardiaca TaxID=1071983 RepID=A0ABY8ARD0_9GAMM|nr:hypothetical protein [Legionella cardiaca]WED42085.1 hypothetical protein PXX05_09075 [Legionella cardiaca]